ncbi:MAG: UbiA family prenyltransferase [Reichenbachiella sp.]
MHLRFPFSFFLLPVFLFALAVFGEFELMRTLLIFLILHVLVYPASNGYNSYFDKDEGSIGGLKSPPKTSIELYRWALILDGVALLMSLLISWQLALMILIYGLVSKAYSHPIVRLKSMPTVGWLATGIFQGYFTFLAVILGLGDIEFAQLLNWQWQLPAVLSSMLLMGSYPMTQIYQHDEDRERGDITLSIKLGLIGTFHFTGLFFFVSNLGFLFYFYFNQEIGALIGFQLALGPVVAYFGYWYWQVRKDRRQADFEHTMRLNLISSTMLNIFFLGWYIVGLLLK